MLVTVWKNGAFNGKNCSFGIKLKTEDREKFFDKSWKNVVVALPNKKEITVNVDKASFWNNTCRELIHREFKEYFFAEKLAPWKSGNPPQMKLEVVDLKAKKFTLKKIV